MSPGEQRTKTITIFIFLALFTVQSSICMLGQEQKEIDKYFKMTIHELLEVEISTAGKTYEKIGDVPASVVLITREDIETYGYMTLTEILENIPGLYNIDDYSDFGGNFGIRGFWSGLANRNMIILVNNVPQISSITSNYPMPKISVPVEAIDRIEVIRGPMSVIYGSGAFYGVINIITNDLSSDPGNQVSASAGTRETKKIFLRLADRIDKFQYVLNASLYDTYGLHHPLLEMTTDLAILPAPDSSTGATLENNEKYFNFSGSLKDFYLNISYNETKKEFYAFWPSYSDGSFLRNTTIRLSLGYRKKMSEIVSIDGKFSYFQDRDWYKFDHLFENFYGVQQMESNAFEVELNGFFNPSSKLEITTGVFYRSIVNAFNMYDLPSFGAVTLENNYIYLGSDDIVTRAMFTQINYKPFKRLRLVAGIRLEQLPKYELGHLRTQGTETTLDVKGTYDQDKIEVIPRFAAIYSLNNRNIFKFLYGKAINRPSFDQNRQNSLDPLRNDLAPERIQTLELNYIGNISSTFIVNASFFRNTLKNLITRMVEFDENNEYSTWSANAGKMVTTGFELTLNAEPFENFRMELSGTYQETKDKRAGFENIEVAYSPKILAFIKAAYHTGKFTFSITGNYVDQMETYWDETIANPDGSFGNRIGDKVDGYFVLGANLRIDYLFVKGLYLNIRCSNLLNEEIRYPATTINDWLDKGTLGKNRTFLISMGYKF